MIDEERPYSSGRDTYMLVVLGVLVGLPLFVFFNIITFGLFILLLIAAGAIALFGGVHYFLWGRGFTADTAGEREEAELRALLEDQDEERLRRGSPGEDAAPSDF
jgi:hypothetical protein